MLLKFKFLLFGLLLSACQNASYDPADFPKNPFFDLEAYFENEMLRTFENGVQKTTTINGKQETVNIDTLNLKEELRLFAEANLNKVSWYEKYSIDTVSHNANNYSIAYTAKDSTLKTRLINIYKSQNNIDSIAIHNHLHSIIMDTDQYLKYDARKGYSVSINQESDLQKTNNYRIAVKY